MGNTASSPALAATDGDNAAVVTSPLVEVVVSKDAKKVRDPYPCIHMCLVLILFGSNFVR